MKYLSFTFLILLLNIPGFAQYQVGVPVYDTIYTGSFYGNASGCLPEEDVNIGLDQDILNIVTGLEYILIINEIDIPQGNLSTTSGVLTVNDSLEFNNTEYYPFFFSAQGSFKFSIIAKGIPQVENQMYPCFLTGFITQVECQNGYVITSDEFSDSCFVKEGVMTNTNETVSQSIQTILFPNPSKSSLNILISDPNNLKYSLEIFNSSGVEIINLQNISSNGIFPINVSNLNPGIYFVKSSNVNHSTLETLIIN